MQTLFQGVVKSLRAFLENPQKILLLLDKDIEKTPLVLKALDGLENEPEVPDIFLSAGAPVNGVAAWVKAIRDMVDGEITRVNQAADTRPVAWDPMVLPPPLEGPPAQQLLALMAHMRGQIPADRQVVWSLYASDIGSTPGYVASVEALLQDLSQGRVPHTKVILRDSPGSELKATLGGHPAVTAYTPDFSPDSTRRQLESMANDPAIPEVEQAQIHMMLAGFDVAEGRMDVALQRNEELVSYFRHTGQRNEESVVQSNIGDLHYLQRDYAQAQGAYEKAILIAADLKSVPLIIYQGVNLGNALFMQQQYEEASTYYQASRDLAGKDGVIPHELRAVEQLGLSQIELGKDEEALESFTRAVELSRKMGRDEGVKANLEQLVQLHDRLGNGEEAQSCREELGQVPFEEVESVPAVDLQPPRPDVKPSTSPQA